MERTGHEVYTGFDEEEELFVAECRHCSWTTSGPNKTIVNERVDLHEGISPTTPG